MKIGEFARMHNIPVSAVRHYIGLGILIPEKDGAQFNFRQQDIDDMETVYLLRNAGFSLKEINIYINTLRGYDKNDPSLYAKVLSILKKQENSLIDKKNRIDGQLDYIKGMTEEYTKKYDTSKENRSSSGIHAQFLEYMACPCCGKHLRLENAALVSSRIQSGTLMCDCGYTAYIDNGILIADINRNLDQDPEFIADYFGDETDTEYDCSYYDVMNTASAEYLALQHRAREWMNSIMHSEKLNPRIMLLPDVSSQFIFVYHDQPYFKDSLIILCVPSVKVAQTVYNHFGSSFEKLKIMVVVSSDGVMPVKDGCVDMLLDYLGSYSYSFIMPDPYVSAVSRYLSDDAKILGSLDYFLKETKSIDIVGKTYANSLKPLPDANAYSRILKEEGFTITSNELIGSCQYSGEYFEYHYEGDNRYTYAYLAERK